MLGISRPTRLFLVLISLLNVFVLGCATQPDRAADSPAKVILIIGDGMDDQQITIARNYLAGSDGQLTLDQLPYRGAVRVQTVDEDDPSKPVYVADSANSATSIATGRVTATGRIATTAKTDEDLLTIMELAHAAGLGTGIVTTSSITDATPASFVSHIGQRHCQGPTSMVGEQSYGAYSFQVDCSSDYKANGGPGSISEQIAASDVDILLGGGTQHFEQSMEGNLESTVIDAAELNGYLIIQDRKSLLGLDSGTKVLGLFSPSTMPVQMRGVGDAVAEPIQTIDGQVRMPEPFTCEPNPDFSPIPRLAEMTQAALRHLDDNRGFVLMIESASIDKQSHVRRPCGHIGELAQLDEALRVALDFAAEHPETLILVTADHSHAAQIAYETSAYASLNFASPGYFARLVTPEGAIMGINYATNDFPTMEDHTGSQVPIFGSGPGSELLPTFMSQTDIFRIAAGHLGLIEKADSSQ